MLASAAALVLQDAPVRLSPRVLLNMRSMLISAAAVALVLQVAP